MRVLLILGLILGISTYCTQKKQINVSPKDICTIIYTESDKSALVIIDGIAYQVNVDTLIVE